MDKGQSREFLLGEEIRLTVALTGIKLRAQSDDGLDLAVEEKQVSDALADVRDQLGQLGPV